MRHYLIFIFVALLLCFFVVLTNSKINNSFPVNITVYINKPLGELKPVWRFFGYDEANYTTMKDGKKLLTEIGRFDGAPIFIRCHHMFTSGDGAYALKWSSTSAYKEDLKGNAIYNWEINDRIIDTYLERGLKPYLELGFMPEDLSTHPENYPHHPLFNERVPVNAGQSYPPKDYMKWGELVYQWTRHCVEKYGQGEVNKWYWEVWNEPNINYWHGTHEEYFKLYDYAINGVRRALPTARVGGPETAGGKGGKFLQEFLKHCTHGRNYATGFIGSPLDFISFHAKGSPNVINGHVRMGISGQLHQISDAFSVIASFPKYKNMPIIISESDPEGCAACQEPCDAYRNGTMYSSYTAAITPRLLELARNQGINIQGSLTWAFEFENQPYFAGFRVLATNGIDLPILNVFRMFSKMSGQQVLVESVGGLNAQTILAHGVRKTPDVSAMASIDKNKLTVLLWHYHDDDLPGRYAKVMLKINDLPLKNGRAKLTEYLIDSNHSNSYEAWKALGSPQQPSKGEYALLEKAGQLTEFNKPHNIIIKDGKALLSFNLQRQAVSLFVLTWN